MYSNFEDHADRHKMFSDLHTETDRDFADNLAYLVKRIRLLHWAMDTLANAEFDVHDDNEWLWNFSEMAFETILADTKRAAAVANRRAGITPKSPMQLTLDALSLVLWRELRDQGMEKEEIDAAVAAKIAIVEAEARREIARTYPDEAA